MFWFFGPSKASTDKTPPPAVPARSSGNDVDEAASQCPVDHSIRARWLSNTSGSPPHPLKDGALPSVLTNGPPCPSSGNVGRRSLSSDRETSSIPRFLSDATGDDDNTGDRKWVYPSPSQFYAALQRKNRSPREEDMNIVVPIHNAVNERTWREVLQWEREANPDYSRASKVQLVSFKGRPMDRTPRAWFKILFG